jgi:CRISPR-associated Cas5-like protein
LGFTFAAPLASFGAIAVGESRPSWDRPAKSAALGLAPAHWGLIARTQTRIVHSPKAIFSQRVARTCRCVRWGASQSTQKGAIMPENKSGAQKAAEAEVVMRVRRVSQLKSCGGDDFAPRLHG